VGKKGWISFFYTEIDQEKKKNGWTIRVDELGKLKKKKKRKKEGDVKERDKFGRKTRGLEVPQLQNVKRKRINHK